MIDPIPNEIARHVNQNEPRPRTVEDLSVQDLSEVATKLADGLAYGTILKWSGGKFLCSGHIEADLAEDVRIMYDLVSLTLDNGKNQAFEYLNEKFKMHARERIIEMLDEMNEMPRGYNLEDYL